jgi:hypothetical protein
MDCKCSSSSLFGLGEDAVAARQRELLAIATTTTGLGRAVHPRPDGVRWIDSLVSRDTARHGTAAAPI